MLLTPRRSNFGPYQLKLRTFKIGHYGRLMSRQAKHAWPFTVVLLGRYVFAGFLVVKATVKLIRVLLKLSSQWVKYAWLVFTLIYLSVKWKKKKKKAKMSEFILNLALGRMVTACFLPSVVRHGIGKLPKRKVRPSSKVDLFMYRT